MSSDYLGKLLIARTVQGDIQFVGRCIGYCPSPTVTVRCTDGSQADWRAELCKIVEIDEQALDLLLPLDYRGKPRGAEGQ